MYQRFFTPPKESFFLFGPRGTGKSTWLRKKYPKALWIDLLNPELFREFSSYPEKLRSIVAAHPRQKIVVIDKVQKVPEILNVIHSLIEEKKGYQFIMTGSSARKLRREGVNLLGGRAILKYMPPFFASEVKEIFSIEKNLKLGMLPIVLDAKSPKEILNAYVGVYLKEEVQEEGIVRNVGGFARFLEIMSFSHGGIINTSNIAREAQIARKTVDNYLHILNDLLLGFELTVFRRKAKRQLISHSKFYYFDAGVYYSLRPKNFYDVDSEKDGVALEGLVAQHLKCWIDAQDESYSINFWQTRSKIEVDFVVSGPGCFLAIEVKNGTAFHPQDFHGLQTFIEDYPEAKGILLYRGKRRTVEKNILCIPVEEFLLNIHPKFPLPESQVDEPIPINSLNELSDNFRSK